jgi:hypothetical protein
MEPGTVIKPLDRYGQGRVWEFRSYYPHPGYRLLGLVPCRNVFIAAYYDRRDRMDGFWPEACKEVIANWRSWFPHADPLIWAGAHDAFQFGDEEGFWDDR